MLWHFMDHIQGGTKWVYSADRHCYLLISVFSMWTTVYLLVPNPLQKKCDECSYLEPYIHLTLYCMQGCQVSTFLRFPLWQVFAISFFPFVLQVPATAAVFYQVQLLALASVAPLAGVSSHDQEVAGFSPGHGTYLGCGFDPLPSAYGRQPTECCLSHWYLPLSLPSFLSKSNEKKMP